MLDKKIINHLLHDVKLAASCSMDDDPSCSAGMPGKELDGS